MSFFRWLFNEDLKNLQEKFKDHEEVVKGLKSNIAGIKLDYAKLKADLEDLKATQPLKVKYKNGMDKKADSTPVDKDNREATKTVPDSSSV